MPQENKIDHDKLLSILSTLFLTKSVPEKIIDNQRAFEEFLVKNKRPDIRNLDSTQLAEKLNEEAATAYWLLFESDDERDCLVDAKDTLSSMDVMDIVAEITLQCELPCDWEEFDYLEKSLFVSNYLRPPFDVSKIPSVLDQMEKTADALKEELKQIGKYSDPMPALKFS